MNGDQEKRLIKLVYELCQEVHSGHVLVENITLDHRFDKDLGLDSLSRVELISRVEDEFKITLEEEVFSHAHTLLDLLRAIQGSEFNTIEISTDKECSVLEVVVDEPFDAKTLIEVLEWHVKQHPDRTHIKFYQDDAKGEEITYLQLQNGAKKVAASLKEDCGLEVGDRVAIMLPTGREYFFSFFGILMAGAIPVPIYPPARLSQLEEHILRHTKILENSLSKILITIPQAVPLAHVLKSQVPSLNSIASIQRLLTSLKEPTLPVLSSDDIAFIQYTSGSTGDPKGVTLTHANLLSNIRAMGKAVEAGSKDVFISWLPLYHDMGLIGAWLGSMYFAALYVVMSPLSFLARPQRWLWAIHKYRGTLSASPNFGYEYCLNRVDKKDFDGLDLSSWRMAFNGAEAVSPDTLHRFIEYFSQYGFEKKAMSPVYGLAESSVGLAFPPLKRGVLIDSIKRDTFICGGKAIHAVEQDTNILRFVSSGLPLDGHQIRVVDSGGHELPERQEGELQFKGPSATSGYFRNKKKTAKLFDGEWLNSGDLAYISNGELFITGRIKDIIIRGGHNIYPDEIEKAVGSIDGIRKGCVAIFGSSDKKTATERLVVLAEIRTKDLKEQTKLRSQINSLVTDIIGTPVDEIVLAPQGSVLKTSSGKIRRSASRDMYEKDEIGKKRNSIISQLIRLSFKTLLGELRRMYAYLKASLFAIRCWLVFFMILPIGWISAVMLPSYKLRWKAMGLSTRLIVKLTGIPLTITGSENIPDDEDSYVIVVNHASYVDSIILAAALRGAFNFVTKSELYESFITRMPLEKLHSKPVERFDITKSIEDIGELLNTLKDGSRLVFFAEGTFSRVPGLREFHLGAFKIAAESNSKVIPISIKGSRSILRDGSWFPRYGEVTVSIGEAIDPTDMTDKKNSWDTSIALRKNARDFILRHCGERDLTLK